jgi:hypothetical protein
MKETGKNGLLDRLVFMAKIKFFFAVAKFGHQERGTRLKEIYSI